MDQHSTPDPEQAYRALLEDGSIKSDPSQAQAMARLQDLHQRLTDYTQQMGRTGWKARLKLGRNKIPPPRGIYMWGGGVGRVALVLGLMFVVSCVTTKEPVTSDRAKRVRAADGRKIVLPTDLDQPLPWDPNVRTGRLPNGLTWYIEPNATPEDRVELWLAVRVGSVQIGRAHVGTPVTS